MVATRAKGLVMATATRAKARNRGAVPLGDPRSATTVAGTTAMAPHSLGTTA